MAEILKLLNRAGTGMTRVVGSSATTLYTCPASTVTMIKKMWVCNVTDADVTLDLWHVESGTTTSDGNKLMDTFLIPANDIKAIDVPVIMSNLGTADTLRALCSSASALTISLYGSEVA